jgi:hypothetical protein
VNLAGLVALGLVLIVGVAMAALGGSREIFMGLVLIGVGGYLIFMGFRYHRDPIYTDAAGQQQTVGPGMLVFLFLMAALLIIGGLYVLPVGLE